ncbi:tRNA (N6-threonylcarbamoyladenosine(37)-N6)-methyltransferase TrmO [[Pseudomonas] carboxydohydrogena]|uniref:tRNA (N6-threonylcarbamoyladenosine(37)-N6)-methyltransferase TrmO n=2 Tax=Afipia carboxydohydrogena TaxID=290 RepID=A0ABY8BWF2_AFICR|nr:tRNA (N6-threonylcarbamoyladenosine(37)-N6)-methyltransferase TrmO [[Pseudomonas] carboxydohydrogena]
MIRFDKLLAHVEIPGSFAVLTPRNDGMFQESAMVRRNEIREGEIAVTPPPPTDAGLTFIGRIHTPWTDRMMTPRQGRQDGPECRIEIFEPWVIALTGIEKFSTVEVLYWLDQSRRDLVLQSPASNSEVHGTFSLRSPVRPNPIGTSIARLVRVEGNMVTVQGLDCLDGTPLIDLKPDRCLFTPIAPKQPGDDETIS